MSQANPTADSESLLTAVGLIWGWLDQDSPEQALTLVNACLVRWPDQPVLHLLNRQCLVLLGLPWPDEVNEALLHPPIGWSALIEKLESRNAMRLIAGRAVTRR